MPDMVPVGNQIIPPNPMAGLNAYSQILELKQQQLALQTGQAQLPGIEAEAAQTQQRNQELSALQQFVSKASTDPQYHNPDGSLNVQKFQADASHVAPVYGSQYIGQMTSNANEAVRNRQSLLDLSNEQRKTIGSTLGAFAADPTANRTSLLDGIEQARAASSDPQYQRLLDNFLLSAPQTHGMTTEQASQALRQYARNAALATNAPNAGESAPAMRLTQGPKGLQATQANPQSPMGVGVVGSSIPQGVAPQVVTQPGTHAPGILHPSGAVTPIGGSSGGTGAAGGTNWWNPAPGQVQLLTANTGALAARIQAGNQAANQSPMAIDALTRARSLLDQGTWTGGTFSAFKDLKNLVAGLGMDTSSAQNASELAKNLARYEAARANGIGNTDAARELTADSGPNTKMDAAAVKAVVLQSLATERMIQGYAKAVGGAQTPQAAEAAEQKFRSVPNLVQTYELGFMRSPQEVRDFAERYGLNPRDLSKQAQELRAMGAL